MNANSVLEANKRFYGAFNKNDIELMMSVWFRDSTSQCIHPGWDVLTGFEDIMVSWQKIFSAGQDLEIKLSHIEVTASESLAWVTCQENLFSVLTSGVQLSKVHSTNLFKQIHCTGVLVLVLFFYR